MTGYCRLLFPIDSSINGLLSAAIVDVRRAGGALVALEKQQPAVTECVRRGETDLDSVHKTVKGEGERRKLVSC